MWEEPKPLANEAVIDRFTPDPGLSWLVAYAGPCEEAKCETPHRICLVPMIGWYEVGVPKGDGTIDEMQLRPVVMGSNGIATDYLDVPDGIRFVGVLRNLGDVLGIARQMYHARFGEQDKPTIVEPEIQQRLPN